ncbi:MAG: KdsC family phosphatase [Gammaproteobacteria bacterium]
MSTAKARTSADAVARAARVRLAVFDVDGVFTDVRLTFDEQGVEAKTFHVRDGLGVKLLMQAGVEVAVLSARRSPVVERRMDELGVRHVRQGAGRKLAVFEALLAELQLGAGESAYIGDDLIDIPVLARVGFAAAVADADPRVLARAHWCTHAPGGAGAVREFCEYILESQGRLDEIIAAHTGSGGPP